MRRNRIYHSGCHGEIYLLADAANVSIEAMKACASRWRKPCKRRGNRSGK